MARPKGVPNPPRKPIKVDREMALAFVAKKEAERIERKSNERGLANSIPKDLKEKDRQYLLGMWEVFRDHIDSQEILDEYPKREGEGRERSGDRLRYTPLAMWNNIKQYFEVSIEYGQPLTIGGICMFNGLDRTTLTAWRRDSYPKEYQFLRDAVKFIEMYNEYAAHMKQNPAGPIFILKNFGWKDTQTHEMAPTEGALTEDERTAAQKRVANFTETAKELPE